VSGGRSEELLKELSKRREEALHAGSPEAVERHHSRGKLTARERLDYLLDRGSFQEIDQLVRSRTQASSSRPYTDGVVTGYGTIDGRHVCVFSQDATVMGGSLGEAFGEKVHKIMDLAVSAGVPIIGLNDGGGARVQEGVVALHYYGGIFYRNVAASGVIPQLSVILGSCAGGAVYSPAITDFVFMVKGSSHMFITGPDVVRAVTGEQVSLEELGGAMTHATKSGVATFVAPDEKACLEQVRHLLSYLPSNNLENPPWQEPKDDPRRATPELNSLMEQVGSPYDVHSLLEVVVDQDSFFEYFAHWAPNLVCGFARIDGHVLGVVANQPAVLAGVLDIDAAEKGARFIRTCDAFGIPLVSFVDVPGFLPGTDQEHSGLIRRGAKLLYAYCEATVPRIQFVTGRAFGGASVLMDSKAIGADLSFAWPSAIFGVAGPQATVDFLYGDVLSRDPEPRRLREQLIENYIRDEAGPYTAAERGFIDQVVEPAETRRVLVSAIELLSRKRRERPARKHGNLPL
jgi:acetyl-CoA carboxylase carboxyltransferase component